MIPGMWLFSKKYEKLLFIKSKTLFETLQHIGIMETGR